MRVSTTRTARRGAVEGHLDRPHLRVAGRLAQEALDRGGERFVRMLQQQGAAIAEDVEDAARRLQRRMGDRMVRRILEQRQVSAAISCRSRIPIIPSTSKTSASASRPSSAARRLRRSGSMSGRTCRRTIGANLRSRSVDSMRASRSSACSSRELVLALRVTRNTSQPTTSMPREKQIEVMRHQLLEKDIALPGADAHAAGGADAGRHLDPGQGGVRIVRVAQRHQQVEGEVGDEGEGVRRIDRLRRHQREDVAVIFLAHRLLLAAREFAVAEDFDAGAAQLLKQLAHRLFPLLLLGADEGVAFGNLLLRRAPVDGRLLHAGGQLLLESADAFHEKFVETGAGDGGEFHPLQQRHPAVLRLPENAAVVGEPAQLPVEIPLRGLQVEGGRRRGGFWHFGLHGRSLESEGVRRILACCRLDV